MIDLSDKGVEEYTAEQREAARLLLARRQARRFFKSWCEMLGFHLMKHHEFICDKLQEVADSSVPRYVMLLLPPGTAKSTYTSKLFPPWYLGHCAGSSILACSHAKDLAISFGRSGRNYVETHSNILGYTLSDSTRAADEWETSTQGRYFCAGVGTGIAGHRADLGLIDDYLGNQEDADSKTVRDKQWNWFINDFWPRVSGTKGTNDGSIIIIANRRHEDDLVGRLTQKEGNESPIPPEKWEIIKLPFFAGESDPLGRAKDEVIWPEKFQAKADAVRRLPGRVRAGLYQQEPRPEDGSYFKNTWLHGYEKQDLPNDLRIYAASDHACTAEDEDPKANATCCILGGWDGKHLWILPDIFWQKADTGEVVRAMLSLGNRLDPLTWWAEKGHISKSIGPFLREEMQNQNIFLRIEEVVPSKNKPTRARSAQAMAEFGRIYFPKFASWWGDAENELLTFDGGRSDDFVDALAHLCRGVHRMVKGEKAEEPEKEVINEIFKPLTMKGVRTNLKIEKRGERKVATYYR